MRQTAWTTRLRCNLHRASHQDMLNLGPAVFPPQRFRRLFRVRWTLKCWKLFSAGCVRVEGGDEDGKQLISFPLVRTENFFKAPRRAFPQWALEALRNCFLKLHRHLFLLVSAKAFARRRPRCGKFSYMSSFWLLFWGSRSENWIIVLFASAEGEGRGKKELKTNTDSERRRRTKLLCLRGKNEI